MKFFSNMRNRLRKSLTANERGQGATEYILLLVVVVGIVFMFKDRIRTAFGSKMTEIEGKMGEITTD